MQVTEIRKSIIASPFRPFILNIADGRRIQVSARDNILLGPQGRTVFVYQPDEDYDILDAMMITGISFDSAVNAASSS